jgi:hypothetical protein
MSPEHGSARKATSYVPREGKTYGGSKLYVISMGWMPSPTGLKTAGPTRRAGVVGVPVESVGRIKMRAPDPQLTSAGMRQIVTALIRVSVA